MNLLAFGAGEGVAAHVNAEVDVLLLGVSGSGDGRGGAAPGPPTTAGPPARPACPRTSWCPWRPCRARWPTSTRCRGRPPVQGGGFARPVGLTGGGQPPTLSAECGSCLTHLSRPIRRRRRGDRDLPVHRPGGQHPPPGGPPGRVPRGRRPPLRVVRGAVRAHGGTASRRWGTRYTALATWWRASSLWCPRRGGGQPDCQSAAGSHPHARPRRTRPRAYTLGRVSRPTTQPLPTAGSRMLRQEALTGAHHGHGQGSPGSSAPRRRVTRGCRERARRVRSARAAGGLRPPLGAVVRGLPGTPRVGACPRD